MKADQRERLQRLIKDARLTAKEIAGEIGSSTPSVYNKLAGRRAWHVGDVERLLGPLSERLGRRITLDTVFRSRTRSRVV